MPGPDSAKYSWLCQAQNVEQMADGRANISAVPVARVALEDFWNEPVPYDLRAPQLGVANIEELAAAPRGPKVPQAARAPRRAPPGGMPGGMPGAGTQQLDVEALENINIETLEHSGLLQLFFSQQLRFEQQLRVMELLMAANGDGDADEDDDDDDNELDDEGDDESEADDGVRDE